MDHRLLIVLGVAGIGLLVLGYHALFGKAPAPNHKKRPFRPGDLNDLTPTEPSPLVASEVENIGKGGTKYFGKDHPEHPEHPEQKEKEHGKHS